MTAFSDWIIEGVATVRADCPMAWVALLDAVVGLALEITVGDEPSVWIHRSADELIVGPADPGMPEEQRVHLETSWQVVLELALGKHALLDVLETGALLLRGAPEALLRFDAALNAFLSGAVRSPRFPSLLTAFGADGHNTTS